MEYKASDGETVTDDYLNRQYITTDGDAGEEEGCARSGKDVATRSRMRNGSMNFEVEWIIRFGSRCE